jgi:hypothetical protein
MLGAGRQGGGGNQAREEEAGSGEAGKQDSRLGLIRIIFVSIITEIEIRDVL